jgi:very-short-patch-repair endonuclease
MGIPAHPTCRGHSFSPSARISLHITDFCAPTHKLIIELDGSHHLDQQEYNTERKAFLEARGYRVLRFWNGDVMNNINSVMGKILEELHDQK